MTKIDKQHFCCYGFKNFIFMKNSDQLKQELKDAIISSGMPSIPEIQGLINDISSNPDLPPANSQLWPIFSLIRGLIAAGMPSSCLSSEFLENLVSSEKVNTKADILNYHFSNVHAVCPFARILGRSGS